MRNIIVDTSVATKWFSQEKEEDFSKALAISTLAQQGKLDLICPEIILIELANVLYFSKKQSQEDCLQSLEFFKGVCTELTAIEDLTLITELIYNYDLPSYDALFVALAITREIPLVTADYKHHKKSISSHIIWLSEWSSHVYK